MQNKDETITQIRKNKNAIKIHSCMHRQAIQQQTANKTVKQRKNLKHITTTTKAQTYVLLVKHNKYKSNAA